MIPGLYVPTDVSPEVATAVERFAEYMLGQGLHTREEESTRLATVNGVWTHVTDPASWVPYDEDDMRTAVEEFLRHELP